MKTIKTSTMGTLNMLGLAKRVKAKMLLTSTSEIYGDPQVHPQPESYWGNVNTIGPRVSRYNLLVLYNIHMHMCISSIYLFIYSLIIRPVMMKGSVWLRQ